MGRTAVLKSERVRIVVSERRVMPFDAAQLRALGIEPSRVGVLVVKSAVAGPAYGDIAREAIVVDAPGVCASDLTSLPFRHAPRPLFPLDAHA